MKYLLLALCLVSMSSNAGMSYWTHTDEMTDDVIHIASITERDTGGGDLIVTCRNKQLAVLLTGKELTLFDDDDYITARVDKKKAVDYYINHTANNQHVSLGPTAKDNILKELKTGSTVIIQYTAWPGTPTRITFKLNGSNAAISKVQTACNR